MFSRRVRAGEVCVVTYHGVLPEGWTAAASPIEGTLVSRDRFRQHLRLLKSRYQLITPESFHSWLAGGSLPNRAVLLTCDDGLRNVLTDMAPILEDEGARCLFFVTGASLEEAAQCLWYEELHRMLQYASGAAVLEAGGKKQRKDSLTPPQLDAVWRKMVEELSVLSGEERNQILLVLRREWGLPEDWRASEGERASRRYRLLTLPELRQLAARGMTIGAHSWSHPLLAKMSAELAEREIRECKQRMEERLGQEIWALAYPFGNPESAGLREMAMAERAGYACAFFNHGGGLSRRTSPRFGLPRAHVSAEMGLAEFEAHLSGYHHALQTRFRGGDGN